MAFAIMLKPLRGQTFKITSEPGETIGDLKRKVAEHGNEFPETLQQLIYRGQILRDSDIIWDLGLKPNQFIVVMLTKAKLTKAQPKPKPVTNFSATMQTPINCPTVPAVVPAVVESAASPQVAPDARAVMGDVPQHAERLPRSVAGGVLAAESEMPPFAPQVTSLTAPSVAPPVTPLAPPDVLPTALPDLQVAGRVQHFPSTHAVIADAAAERAARPLSPQLAGLRHSREFASIARMLLQEPQALRYLLPTLLQGNPDIAHAIQDDFPGFVQLVQEVGSRPQLSDGNWDELLASNPELLEEMMPEIEAMDLEMAEAIRSDPAAFLTIFERKR